MGLLTWLKHAFAVDPPGPAEPTERQREVVETLCREVVRRRMTTPALLTLEMTRPLNHLGSQALVFFRPFIQALTDADGHRHLAEFLEHRGSVEYLCRRIEALEAETNHERHETHEQP
jgi:hypothetical protein